MGVVNIKNTTSYDVYIGRRNGELEGSIWHNPFKEKELGRDGCIDKYEEYLRNNIPLLHQLPKLSNKTLACWCKPKRCHGDILYRYASKEEGKFRLLISGSRNLYRKDIIEQFIVETLMPKYKDIIIIEGGARGIDRAAREVAQELKLDYLTIPAIWDVNGTTDRSAGYKRNDVMLKLADGVLCIWDGRSRGTSHMARESRKRHLPSRTIVVK